MKKISNINSIKKIEMGLLEVGTVYYVALLTMFPAFADEGDEIVHSVNSGLGQVYKIITSIVLPIAVVVIAVTAIKMMYGDRAAAETGRTTIIRVIITLGIIYLAPLLISTVSTWFSNVSSNTSIFS